MDPAALNEKASAFRAMHDDGDVLVLPNAWDAGSAVLLASLGARAVATTSGGVAWSLGCPDGEHLTREEMVRAVRPVTRAVTVPVTADMEAGYGPSPDDVAATVEAVLEAGVVGINLEDSRAAGGPLYTVEEQAERLAAARSAAVAAGVPDFVVNARTDVFLFQVGEAGGRLEDVLRRADAYAEAGATSLFVPGLLDLDQLGQVTKASSLPVNALAMPGGPGVADLRAAGVRRISVGAGLAQVAYSAALGAARELLEDGTLGGFDGALGFVELDGFFSPPGS